MLKALQRAKSIVQSPPTDGLPPALAEAREKYLRAKSHLSQLLDRASRLNGKLDSITLRLEALPEEKRRLQMARRPAIADQALDATKQSALRDIDAHLTALVAEEATLKEEHEMVKAELNQLRCINGGLEKAQAPLSSRYREMWDQVAATLASQVPVGTAEQLLKIWVALSIVKPASPMFLLTYINMAELDRENQIRLMREIAGEFHLPPE